ncbi:MAG TPA: lipopolysaccharide biosynthesis protein [Thermoanaerobaculia bacterium]|nr:lipopolysaccharide biosynthesis protein [Thermoanaerobaculia bacterium]
MTERGERIGRSTARAALWAFAATAAAKTITLVGLAILARFLAPHEFGLLAFALVYITYAETIGDLGTGVALIYWPDRKSDAAQVTFLINLVMGIAWCLVTLAIAPGVARFFQTEAGEPIIQVLAIGFLIRFLGNTHDALAQKELRFRARLVPEVALATGKAIIAVALAVQGFGAWSLVWGHLGGLCLWTLFLWIVVPWRPRLSLAGLDLLRPMLAYGRGIIAVNVLAAVVHHADLAIVGRMLGATALGLYQMASKIPEVTITVIVWVVSRVLFPAFSRLNAGGHALADAYLTAMRYVSAITIPIATGLFFLAEPIILLSFGDTWAPAIPILRALAIYGGLRSLGTHAGDVLKAVGKSNLLARLALLKAAVLVPALLVAAGHGVLAVAWSMVAVTIFANMLNIVVVSRILETPVWSTFRSLGPSAAAGAILALALALWNEFGLGHGDLVRLGIAVLGGAGVYLLALRWLDPRMLSDVLRLVGRAEADAPASLRPGPDVKERQNAGAL